jgi:hypothetical protein
VDDADGAQLLGYLMVAWADHELTARGVLPPPTTDPLKDE